MEKRSIIGLEEALIKRSRKVGNFVYEDSKDVKDYKSTISNEKQHTILYANLIPGEEYFPMSLRGAPFQQTVYIDIPPTDVVYTMQDGVDLVFTQQGVEHRFRVSKNNAVGTIETLIFKDKTEADHFITMFKTKFSSWYIPVTKK
jgi:hypothetical protein